MTFSGTAAAGIFKAGKKAAVAAPTTAATKAADAINDYEGIDFDNDGEVSDEEFLASTYSSEFHALVDAAQAEAKANAGSAAVKAAKDFTVYTGIDINIKASTTTDNGMTISAATDMGAGSIPDIADKELDAQTDDLTAPEVKIGYNGVTIELQSEGVDDYYDGDLENYDIGVTGSFGGLSYGIALETESKTASDYSAMVGYTIAGVSLSAKMNEVNNGTDLTAISASYTMGAIKATLTNDNKGAAKDVNTFAVQYTAGPAVITASMKDDKNNNTTTKTANSLGIWALFTQPVRTQSARQQTNRPHGKQTLRMT